MKTPVIIFFLAFAIYFTSCSRADQSSNEASEIEEVRGTVANTVKKGENVFDIPTLEKLFVTKSDGSFIYEKADNQSTVLGTLEYGYMVEVIGEKGEWYQIKERVGRNFIRNGSEVYSSGWEVVNIPKQYVGLLAQIKLSGSDLYETYDKAPVKRVLELQLIPEGEFNRARKKKDGFIVKQETLVSIKDSLLTVAIGNGANKVFVSTPSAEDEKKVYNYVGHISYLNAYLLAIGYYEEGEYMLYNAENGEKLISFNDYPEISPDGSYIVSMYTNPYEQSTDFQLYTVASDKSIQKKFETSFSNWMVGLEPYEVYWVDNSTLVIKVLHAKAFWDETGDLNNDYQYLRMKIL